MQAEMLADEINYIADGQEGTDRKTDKQVNNPLGRPSSYTDKVGKYICRELQTGKTITYIYKEEGMPCFSNAFNQLSKLDNVYNE